MRAVGLREQLPALLCAPSHEFDGDERDVISAEEGPEQDCAAREFSGQDGPEKNCPEELRVVSLPEELFILSRRIVVITTRMERLARHENPGN